MTKSFPPAKMEKLKIILPIVVTKTKEINQKDKLERDPILRCIPWEIWQSFFTCKINEDALKKIKSQFFYQNSKFMHDPAIAAKFLAEIDLDEGEEPSFSLAASLPSGKTKTFLFLLYFYPNIADSDWLNLAKRNRINESLLGKLSAISGRKTLLECLVTHLRKKDPLLGILNSWNSDWEALCLAAAYGRLSILQYFFELFPNQKKHMLQAKNYDVFSSAAATGKVRVLQCLLAETDIGTEREAMLTNQGNFKALKLACKNSQNQAAYFILTALGSYRRGESDKDSSKTHPVLSKPAILRRDFKQYSALIVQKSLRNYQEDSSKTFIFLQRFDALIKSGFSQSPWFESLCQDMGNFQALLANYPLFHAKLVKQLLSSPPGLHLFYHLLEAGFDAFAPLRAKDRDLMQHHIYTAGSSWQFYFSSNNPAIFNDFLAKLNSEAKALIAQNQKKPLEPKAKKSLFHAAFILSFLDLHNQIKQEFLDLLRHSQANYLLDEFIATEQTPENAYQLARASGFSFSQLKDGLMILLKLSAKKKLSYEMEKAFFLFVLEHYLDNTRIIFDPALIIALEVGKEWLRKDLTLDFNGLNQSLNHHYEAYLSQNSEPKHLKSKALFIRSSFQLQKILASFLVALKKESINVDHPLMTLETFTQNLEEIKTYDHISLAGVLDDDSLFAQSLQDLKTCLTKKKVFYEFLSYLNTLLGERLIRLPFLDMEFNQNKTLKFRLLNIPNEEAFLAWKKIPWARKKLAHAMNHTLAELEENYGYRGSWPLYSGSIPPDIANKDLFFRECRRNLPGLLHGKDTHRIQLAALRFFVERKYISLPSNKTAHDLLLHIVTSGHWDKIFDQVEQSFSCPEFLMTYLRNQDNLKFLRIYALFSFFKGMNEILKLHQDLEYKDLLLLIPTGLNSSLSTDPFKAWLAQKAYPCEMGKHQNGESYARYFKPPKASPKKEESELSSRLSSSI